MFMVFHAPRSHKPVLIAVCLSLLALGIGAGLVLG